MRVAQIGHFGAPHSTENELYKAFVARGHDVLRFQENRRHVFCDVGDQAADFDLILWTRTGWNPPVPHDEQRYMLCRARDGHVRTVGYHLDRWFGLAREWEVRSEPFFRCDLMCTADGGHDDRWRAEGIEHRWLPPAVSEFECVPGVPRDEFRSEVAFVGSWQSYHDEWTHRRDLVEWLRRTFGARCAFWPRPGEHAVRGDALRDLYASTRVLVGDSCLVGGAHSYFSDRVPESLGRGGFLIHPHVDGVTDGTLYVDGKHLVTWPLGDWDQLRDRIDWYLANDAERVAIAQAGRDHVLAAHTYTVRVAQLEELLA